MAASARWKTQGRSPGVRGARSRGMENVALNEITTATCEPSEIATSKGLKITSPLKGPHSCATVVVNLRKEVYNWALEQQL